MYYPHDIKDLALVLCLFYHEIIPLVNFHHCLLQVLMSIATWSPLLWSSWHEAILMWLGLLEGVFVPVLLFCKDHALNNALRRTFQRRSGALSPLVSK